MPTRSVGFGKEANCESSWKKYTSALPGSGITGCGLVPSFTSKRAAGLPQPGTTGISAGVAGFFWENAGEIKETETRSRSAKIFFIMVAPTLSYSKILTGGCELLLLHSLKGDSQYVAADVAGAGFKKRVSG